MGPGEDIMDVPELHALLSTGGDAHSQGPEAHGAGGGGELEDRRFPSVLKPFN